MEFSILHRDGVRKSLAMHCCLLCLRQYPHKLRIKWCTLFVFFASSFHFLLNWKRDCVIVCSFAGGGGGISSSLFRHCHRRCRQIILSGTHTTCLMPSTNNSSSSSTTTKKKERERFPANIIQSRPGMLQLPENSGKYHCYFGI